ncbi:MAG: ferrous iron transport protein B [Ruminococcaceae bacterium]|nr:ferrous iron transport protein B [Oscillospiraceae bacterium]
MGLTLKSVGKGILDDKITDGDGMTVLMSGNPNVGKSTLFNCLTGMHQHTGNWTGKTVSLASGKVRYGDKRITLIDLPGCFSLNSRSEEERVARDCIYFENYDSAVVVCDASCLSRHLYLALQICQVSPNTVICVNLADEAKKRGITVDTDALSKCLKAPCVLTSAKKKSDCKKLISLLDKQSATLEINYGERIENYISDIYSLVIGSGISRSDARVFALRLLDSDEEFCEKLKSKLSLPDSIYQEAKSFSASFLDTHYGGSVDLVSDEISDAIIKTANSISSECVNENKGSKKALSFSDRLLIGKFTAFPIMLALLFFVLWLTVKGANYPSDMLRALFNELEAIARTGFNNIGLPTFISAPICEGIIRVTGWVVSVMLPPMAIFFPMFTLLEDVGYLPRFAFNLDRCFSCSHACGKQALTMCMGLGCNAAGVVGCRIIDSPRERDIALLTNSFMPCNGRFPMLIAIIGIFFASSGGATAAVLVGVLAMSVAVTLAVSYMLSKTVLRGKPSSFTLELPPFRMPNVGQVITRSIFDRTLFVLGRAISVAAPTGLFIWLIANINIGNASILSHATELLDPIGRFIGLDGVILLGFLLGLPANEIVVPVIIMAYTSGSALTDYSSLSELKNVFINNGWTAMTAVNFIIFTVFHWPCSTTLLTVKKETSSIKKTAFAFLLPTAVGIILCLVSRLIFCFFE